VVGIVCGMALDGLGLARDKALVAFAWTPDGRTKVSSRSPHELQARGIDLAAAMREAAAALGGQGGGHKGAAGATIPRGEEARFVAHVDRIVAAQLGVRTIDLAPPPAGLPGPATESTEPGETRSVVSADSVAGPVSAAPMPFLRSRGPQTRLAL
jgi:hypothetical protein